MKFKPRLLEIEGIKNTIRAWSKVSQTPIKTIQTRLKLGYSDKAAVFTVSTMAHKPKPGHPWQKVYRKEVVR